MNNVAWNRNMVKEKKMLHETKNVQVQRYSFSLNLTAHHNLNLSNMHK